MDGLKRVVEQKCVLSLRHYTVRITSSPFIHQRRMNSVPLGKNVFRNYPLCESRGTSSLRTPFTRSLTHPHQFHAKTQSPRRETRPIDRLAARNLGEFLCKLAIFYGSVYLQWSTLLRRNTCEQWQGRSQSFRNEKKKNNWPANSRLIVDYLGQKEVAEQFCSVQLFNVHMSFVGALNITRNTEYN